MSSGLTVITECTLQSWYESRVFKQADLLTDRGLGQAQLARGGGHALMPCGGIKGQKPGQRGEGFGHGPTIGITNANGNCPIIIVCLTGRIGQTGRVPMRRPNGQYLAS